MNPPVNTSDIPQKLQRGDALNADDFRSICELIDHTRLHDPAFAQDQSVDPPHKTFRRSHPRSN
ncbi:MAG TPA: hypothetical protein VN709_04725 [Terriglobales bacterium]|nr:hypothetical protein [Terriglobales bacterium]